jgi:3-dehydroquinate dehydratase
LKKGERLIDIVSYILQHDFEQRPSHENVYRYISKMSDEEFDKIVNK